jgi:hypothetical protein
MTQSRYVIDSIQFDWVDGDFECPLSFRQGIIDAAMCTVWYADNEEDVVNQITESAAFCVSSVQLYKVPNRF